MSQTQNNSSPPSDAGTFRVAWRLLVHCGAGEGWLILWGLLVLLIGSLVSLLGPWPLKLVFDGVLGKEPLPGWLAYFNDALASGFFAGDSPKLVLLGLLCFGLLVVQLLMGALTVLSTYVLVAIGLRMVFRLRCDLFNHIQKLSLAFHDATTVGDSLYRVAWDSFSVQAIFNSGLMPAITSGVTLVGIAAIMFTRDWIITLIALSVSVPLIILVRWMDRPMTEGSMRVHERESEISTRIQETLTGIRAVQAFGQEGFESERFRTHAQAALSASLRLTVFQTASQVIIGAIIAAGTAAIVWISARRVMQSRLTPGDVWLMVSYIAMLFKPIEQLAYTAANIQGAAAGARRVFSILDSRPDVCDAPDAVDLPARATGRMTLENVCFGYLKDQKILRDVTLEMPPSRTVALVGPSGAGKTTLISLLMRFYDPLQGRITLDGRDLRSITLKSLRRNISLVLQEPVLFCASIHENIAYGKPNATKEQIESAARAAGAHDFIMALGKGYETEVGERGASLSGGQRQRISIARAFLKDAPILIMDEPTSALDAETEGHLLEALARLKQGRTTIIIAHRLSTIRNADMIVVMKDGLILETGTHAQLVNNNNLYARLHAVQFGPIGVVASADSLAAPAVVPSM